MLVDELKGLVGLSSNVGVEAESGLYVDALPDISTSTIDMLTQKNESACDTWEKLEQRTILRFRTQFHSAINKCHKVNDIAVTECLIISNKLLLAQALWYLLGAEVMMTRSASSRVNIATIDRNKPKELRQYFEDQFEKELEVAVANIDIHSSECFLDKEEPECRETITTQFPRY